MKTSRIAKDTARVALTVTHADYVPRRQTRAFAASLHAFQSDTFIDRPSPRQNGRHARDDDSPSSTSSSYVKSEIFDMEDAMLKTPASLKRKRGYASPATSTTVYSTTISTRTSPRTSDLKSEDGQPTKIRKARRQPAKRIVADDGDVHWEAPANWWDIYENVLEMRKERIAPVDTMGCETLAQAHLSPRDRRFQTLIALMLSSQTKDTTNAIAMGRLQQELPEPGLTLENILDVDPVKLNELIYVVGFHNNKTRFIKATALILRDQFNSDIPDTIEGLTSLPGVGPKMAYLCLSAAWGRTEGIGVDVHVHRITNLWGWHKTKGPEETRAALESWLPKERWHEINHLLVGFGQTICPPVGRRCGKCTLATKGLCPSAVVDRTETIKRIKKSVVKETAHDGVLREGIVDTVVVKKEETTVEDLAV